MAKDYEDYRRRNERTQEAVRRRRNADYATRRSAGYYEDVDYSEPVRRARQTGSTKRSGTNAKRRQTTRSGNSTGSRSHSARSGSFTDSRRRDMRSVGAAGRRNKKRRHPIRRFLLCLLLIVALCVGGIFVYLVKSLNTIENHPLSDVTLCGEQDANIKNYTNIALFGVDSREGDLDSGTNSDTIMVCSINNKSGEIKLVSVYRDTYLDVNDGHYSKANSAYAGGGPERAINMLNKNLDLDITDFVTVDFNAVIKAVDLLGGIDIDLTDEEVKWLNAYLIETSQVTGVSYENVAASGTQHLSGIQAMAYCRIRYTEGWDYKRTERQRLVLEKIFAAAQAQGVTGLAGLINTMIPYIKTSLSNTEMLALAANIGKYSITDTQGFPYDKQAADVDAGDCVVPVNLASNVSQLHSYLFSESGYTPSDTVQQIRNLCNTHRGALFYMAAWMKIIVNLR